MTTQAGCYNTLGGTQGLGILPALGLFGWAALGALGVTAAWWKSEAFGTSRDYIFYGAPKRIEPSPDNLASLQDAMAREKARYVYQQREYNKATNTVTKQQLADDIAISWAHMQLYSDRIAELRAGNTTRLNSLDALLERIQRPVELTMTENGMLVPKYTPPTMTDNVKDIMALGAEIFGIFRSKPSAPTVSSSIMPLQQDVVPIIIKQSEPVPVPVSMPEDTFKISNIMVPAGIALVSIAAVVAMFSAARR